jgi:magnesium-protoporphyrin IX monomethyl ester (oxidative) cyclase
MTPATMTPEQVAAFVPPNATTASAVEEAALNPRFYTTDFAELDRLDVSSMRAEWDALVAEFRRDPNKDHFKRTAEFDGAFDGMKPEVRRAFVEFLTSSVTAEFSGCILYAEIKRRVTNPDVRELFGFMSRDEGRHAGFINHTLDDAGVKVDLSFLTRAKKYTYFKPKYIYYATYLSEKIGYARYIHVYRHLERHPELRFHPIFRWFENWCNDEFRHGEAFAVLMRANPETLRGINKLWIRFFLLAVFATMYVRDHMRKPFFDALGMDVDEYDDKVIRLTNDISRQCFPETIDLDNPGVWRGFARMLANQRKLEAMAGQGGVVAAIRRKLVLLDNGVTFLRTFLASPRRQALPADVRMQPVW